MTTCLSAVIVLGLMFGTGVLVGKRMPPPIASPVADLEITRSALLDALDPSDQQRAELVRIMEQTRGRADSVMGQLLGEIRFLARDAEGRVRGVLSPQQNAALDTLLAHPTDRVGRRRVSP